MMAKTCVVFGGSGFIGTHLARLMVGLGWQVTVADIVPLRQSESGQITYQYCDVREEITLPLAGEVDLVVNLAAIHRTPGHADSEYFSTNVVGAHRVVAFCEQRQVPVLWFTSSISVYGSSEDPKTESDPTEPTSAYGKSKLEAEAIYRAWQGRDQGRQLVVVRPAAVFGPGEYGNFSRLARSLRSGLFFYAGRRDTIKSCGYVDDLIDSLSFMQQIGEGVSLYNFCYPERYTIEDICTTMAQVGGLRKPRGTLPLRLLLVGARVLKIVERVTPASAYGFHPERVYKLFRSTNVIPQRLVEAGFAMPGGLADGFRRWHEADPSGEFV